ncbi:uncharacterized protein [Onthophagus taurus]|uniref:uncharacterized protein n=1 Tax=Onthophagus taurus TaxID=166361 RepID=UPI0039BDF326
MSQSENLTKKRGIVKGKLTNFAKFVIKFESNIRESGINQELSLELEQRYNRAINLIDEFEEIQGEIDLLSVDGESQNAERETFEASFYANTAKAKRILTNRNICADSSFIVGPSPDQHVKLPVIDLPKFDGGYDAWLGFRDIFESLIHNNPMINDIQKFHYLLSALTGNARQVIESLELTNSNYEVAWGLIRERYDNPRILIHNHVKALFEIEGVSGDNPQPIRSFIDDFRKHLRALAALNEPTDNWDTLLIYLAVSKLDADSNREWERKKSGLKKANLENLLGFLKERADLLETLENGSGKRIIDKSKPKSKTFLVANSGVKRCVNCKGEHYIQECSNFTKLTVQGRIDRVKQLKVCMNCLRSGHFVKQCRSSSCKRCNSRHHTLLHLTHDRSDSPPQPTTSTQAHSLNFAQHANHSNILLSTVTVHAFDRHNKKHSLRALLDPGSQSSFLSVDACKRLRLSRTATNVNVATINQTQSTITSSCSLRIHSHCTDFSLKVNCLVIATIANDLPNFEIDANTLRIPTHVRLADPLFNKSDKIDMLIGADYFWNLLCVGQIKLAKGPIMQNTRLGWIVSGPIQASAAHSVQCNLICKDDNSVINKQLARFWEIEEIEGLVHSSKNETFCENHFNKTTKRAEDGRFIVSLPLKESLDRLGESYKTAENRLMGIERKCKRNREFGERYHAFMREYLELGHMKKVVDTREGYYIPHHGVLNENSATTKLRVVFDASCPTSTGYSLNDCQVVGPILQPDLFSALIRFRKYAYVVTADIQKMYRACLINPEQTKFQRILWRDSEDSPVDTYELLTITYGTSSASYLATRCLKQLSSECADPVIADVINSHFYVDDLLTGANSLTEVTRLAKNVKIVLNGGGFNLHKWISNDPEILRDVQGTQSTELSEVLDLGKNENTRTLGLLWDPTKDCFRYKMKENSTSHITKRTVLSKIAQIFDPLGLLSPVIITAKIILQEIWESGLGWDEALPNHIYTSWLRFSNSLKDLHLINCPRHISLKNPSTFEMHGFSDSSTKAYGACVYLRTIGNDGEVLIRLTCAKSRVAPLKRVTVPRLELMGALLLTELVAKVKTALGIDITRTVYWTDSSVVLGWLSTDLSKLQMFVGNRISRILEKSRIGDWRYVPTRDNPADPVSRGVNVSELSGLELYWTGPQWLRETDNAWPVRNFRNESLPEMRKLFSAVTTTDDHLLSFSRFSSLIRLQRVIAYVFRFAHNCYRKAIRNTGPLDKTELEQSLKFIVKISQRDSFAEEIRALKSNKDIQKNSKLAKLNVFLDKNEIMRVGGRLGNSDYEFDKKFPMVISCKHAFARLLFEMEHRQLLHVGPQHLLACIRDRFWPIGGRNLAKSIVHNCIRCYRANPRAKQPVMGNLPRERVTPAPPFYTTGVDYAGPFLLKDKKGRGAKLSKAYVCLFVCFTTRAIHLELVTELTTECFIAALRRFSARRGKPNRMFSDNGTNFVGGNRELQELSQFLIDNSSELKTLIENASIGWSFIPPNSPHFGGLWEAGVKSVKFHLRRVAGNASFTYENFYTLLVQIEAILNSRPLTQLSTDPNDTTPLTPAHFLIGRKLTSPPDPSLSHISENRLSQFQRVQQIQQHFWTRWSKEYLSELQSRHKWSTGDANLKVGQLALIKEDNLPVLKWLTGRIIELHCGKDGVARVATLRTQNGIVKGATVRLCPLPME